MKKTFLKILAITTALVMLLGAVPFAVSGNTEVADDLIALGAGASVVDSATRTVANGKVTEKVKVSVPGESYVQFNKLLKGNFSVVIESANGSDFSGTPVQVQLTTDASAAADINPTDAQKAVTWYFYPNTSSTGRLHAGFGNTPFDDCQYNGCWSMSGGIQLNLTKQADTSIAVQFGSNAAEYADGSKLNTQPLSNLANYDGGVYLRIRSPWNVNEYTVSLIYDAEPVTVGNWAALENSSTTIEPISSTVENGKVIEKVKLTILGEGYAQFNKLLKGNFSVIIQADDFPTTPTQVQLTTDASAAADINPTDTQKAVTWYFYPNTTTTGRIHAGFGNTPFDDCQYNGCWSMSEGIQLNLTKQEDTSIAVKFGENAAFSDGSQLNTQPLSNLTNYNGGVYLRIRSPWNDNEYTVTVIYDEEPETPDPGAGADVWVSSNGVTVNNKEVSTNGNIITYKADVTIPQGGYVQMNKLLTGNASVSIDTSDFSGINVQPQLTTDASAATDIDPADSANDRKALSWLFYESGGTVWTGRNSSTVGGGDYGSVSALNSDALRFNFRMLGDYRVGVNYGSVGAELVSNQTQTALENFDSVGGVYFRLRNRGGQKTFTVTISYEQKSADNEWNNLVILGVGSTLLKPVSKTTADGKVTLKAEVSIPADGYVQFNQLLKGDFGVVIEAKDGSDFSNSPVHVQLTPDASAAKDIDPTDTQKAVSWFFYPSSGAGGTGRLHAGFGYTPFDDCQYAGCWSMGEGLQLNLTKQADTSIAVKFGSNAQFSDGSQLNTQPLSNLANYNGGVYVRIRSPWDVHTYTVTLTYADTAEEEPEADDSWKVSGDGCAVKPVSVISNGDTVSVTTQLTIPQGGYVQFNRLLTSDVSVNIKAQLYRTLNVTAQLTADATAAKDIVPVDEYGGLEPGLQASSWRLASYDNGNGYPTILVGQGNSLGGAFEYGYAYELADQGGISFDLKQDGNYHTWFASRTISSGAVASHFKSKNPVYALDDYQGGVYFRLRNMGADQIFTVTLTYKNVSIDSFIKNGSLSVDKTGVATKDNLAVTITPDSGYQLKAGSLRINGTPVSKRVNKGVDETTCNQFIYTAKDAATGLVTAQFIPISEVNMTILGASYNNKDFRFVSRAYRAKGDVALLAAGQLLMRSDCDLAAGVKDGEKVANIDALLARAADGTTGTNMVKNLATTKLNDRCTDYVDFAIRINGAGKDAYKNVKYICIAYTIYEDGTIAYSEACVRSYNDIVSGGQISNEKPQVLSVKDFGAVGDGTTNDMVPVSLAMAALRRAPAGSTLEFEAGKTYYVKDINNGCTERPLLSLQGKGDLTIKGNNTGIVLGGTNLFYAKINDTQDITIEGFNFDYGEYKAAFKGTVEGWHEEGWLWNKKWVSDNYNTSEKWVIVTVDRDIHMTEGETYYPPMGDWFATIPADVSRHFCYIDRYVKRDGNRLQVYFRSDTDMTNVVDEVRANNFVFPMPYTGNCIETAFNVEYNADFTMKNCNIYSTSRHGFSLQYNTGEFLFENVNFKQAPYDEGLRYVSWADTYHVLHSRAKYTWRNCFNKWNYDDVFNISSATMLADAVYSSTDILLRGHDGSIDDLQPGDKLTFIDTSTGAVFRTTVASSVAQDISSKRVTLNNAVPFTSNKANWYVWSDSHCAPGSEFIGCDFDGTFRARTALTMTNCEIQSRRFWIGLEAMQWEGPLPTAGQEIKFINCNFKNERYFDIETGATKADSQKMEYIIFDNCTGVSATMTYRGWME